MLPIQPQPPPNAPTTIAKTLFTVTGKVALLFPATSRPHCTHLPTAKIYVPSFCAVNVTAEFETEVAMELAS